MLICHAMMYGVIWRFRCDLTIVRCGVIRRLECVCRMLLLGGVGWGRVGWGRVEGGMGLCSH